MIALWKKSLRFRFTVIIAFVSVCMGAALIFITSGIYQKRIDDEYENKVVSFSKIAASLLDGELIDRYLSTLETDEEYDRILGHLLEIRKVAEVKYVYVSIWSEADRIETFVFDADEPEMLPLGYRQEMGEDEYGNLMPPLRRKEALVPYIVESEEWGTVLVGGEPIFRGDGSVAAYACVAVSVNRILQERMAVFVTSIAVITLFFSAFVAIGLYTVQRFVVVPVRALVEGAAGYRPGEGLPDAESFPEDEFGALGRALHGMKERIECTIAAQRETEANLERLVGERTRELELQTEAAHAASRSKSAFLANMSHELRTPLNTVIGITDLMLGGGRCGGEVAENLGKIGDAGNTLLSIVNDILDFSKIESGKLELVPAEYQLPSLLNDVVTLITTQLGEKPIEFRLNIGSDLPGSLHGDDLRVKQIFNNLLSNAFKYTHSGSIELGVACVRDGASVWLEIAVSDTGIGIRAEDLPKLFRDYAQLDTGANRKIEGTGLGLSITRRLVEMMDGEITVESEYGRGSTFRARVRQGYVPSAPIGPAVAENLRSFRYAEGKRTTTAKLVYPDLSHAKVLVVDDMQTNLFVAQGLLRKYKIQVDCVSGGREAVERIRRADPTYNAIFMDHMMPDMDGIEATDAIRAIGTDYARNVPIIALTANAIQGTEDMFLAHGFQDFLSKPIDIMRLDAVVRKWIKNAQ